MKLLSSWKPARWLFSGWNWKPATCPRSTAEANPPPYGDGASTSARVLAAQRVAVHEVEVAPPSSAGEERRLALADDFVPADVRHALALALGAKARDLAADRCRGRRRAALRAGRREQLHPEAEAEERHPRSGDVLLSSVGQPARADVAPSRRERADAGQDDGRGLPSSDGCRHERGAPPHSSSARATESRLPIP